MSDFALALLLRWVGSFLLPLLCRSFDRRSKTTGVSFSFALLSPPLHDLFRCKLGESAFLDGDLNGDLSASLLLSRQSLDLVALLGLRLLTTACRTVERTAVEHVTDGG
jgi:hypothetical protein